MRVLGLDLSLSSPGWSLLDSDSDTILGSGTFPTKNTQVLSARLAKIAHKVAGLAAIHEPDLIVVETPISFNSGTTTINIAMVHGGVRVKLAEQGYLELTQINPTSLKLFATGNARAKKPEMIEAALKRWHVELGDDEADASFLAAKGYEMSLEEDNG